MESTMQWHIRREEKLLDQAMESPTLVETYVSAAVQKLPAAEQRKVMLQALRQHQYHLEGLVDATEADMESLVYALEHMPDPAVEAAAKAKADQLAAAAAHASEATPTLTPTGSETTPCVVNWAAPLVMSTVPPCSAALAPGQVFAIQWGVTNDGAMPWKELVLRHVLGEHFTQITMDLPDVPAGASVLFEVDACVAPTETGPFFGVWCLFSTVTQQYVGDLFALVIVVDPTLPIIPDSDFLSADHQVSAKVLAELFADSSAQTANMTDEDLAQMEALLTRHCAMEETMVQRTLRRRRRYRARLARGEGQGPATPAADDHDEGEEDNDLNDDIDLSADANHEDDPDEVVDVRMALREAAYQDEGGPAVSSIDIPTEHTLFPAANDTTVLSADHVSLPPVLMRRASRVAPEQGDGKEVAAAAAGGMAMTVRFRFCFVHACCCC
jgi:hypothetical protein